MIILNLVALLIAVVWMIKTNYEFEPLIAVITLLTTLLGQFFYKGKKVNKAKITGSNNKIFQSSSIGNKKSDENYNDASIDGNFNEVNQQ